MRFEFTKAKTGPEKEAIDLFLTRHNSRGKGSTRGYVACYAAMWPPVGEIEGYILDGQRSSLRKGPKTLKVGEIPANARIIRNRPMHRYCWAVGPPLKRAFRRRKLVRRMSRFKFVPAYQPRLLTKLQEILGFGVWPLWRRNKEV
jgi:hypothetical protein